MSLWSEILLVILDTIKNPCISITKLNVVHVRVVILKKRRLLVYTVSDLLE